MHTQQQQQRHRQQSLCRRLLIGGRMPYGNFWWIDGIAVRGLSFGMRRRRRRRRLNLSQIVREQFGWLVRDDGYWAVCEPKHDSSPVRTSASFVAVVSWHYAVYTRNRNPCVSCVTRARRCVEIFTLLMLQPTDWIRNGDCICCCAVMMMNIRTITQWGYYELGPEIKRKYAENNADSWTTGFCLIWIEMRIMLVNKQSIYSNNMSSSTRWEAYNWPSIITLGLQFWHVLYLQTHV